MNIVKKFFKPIICGIMFIILALPYGSVSMVMGGVEGPGTPFSGYEIFKSFWGFLIIGIMVVICAIDFVKAFRNFAPVVGAAGGVLIAVLGFFAALSVDMGLSMNGMVETSSSIGVGYIIFAVLAIALSVLSIVLRDKSIPLPVKTPDLSNITNVVGNVRASVANHQANADAPQQSTPQQSTPQQGTPQHTSAPVQRSVNRGGGGMAMVNEMEAKFSLIGKFFEMKEKGILTEEEFAEQKKKILDSINI